LIQAVVVLGEKTSQGNLIEAIAPAWSEIVRQLKDNPCFLLTIDPRKLEELIAGAYVKAGYSDVILTPRSGDFGRDVIASRKDWGQIRFIDQVKAYKPGHLVTAEEVRALGHVLQADHNATKGLVTTTSDFAPRIADDPFIRPYIPFRIELVNGTELLRKLKNLTG
jgi:restriction system protein